MFEINDSVLYGSHGVCKIAEISEQNFGGATKKYYILKPVHNSGSTVYVPADSEALTSKMRRVLSTEEIYSLIRDMPDEELFWVENESERKEHYREVLTKGDRRELIQMIKALYQHQEEQVAKGKKLHVADERFFKDAEKLLYEEFALVLHIKPSQVLPFILEQIQLKEE